MHDVYIRAMEFLVSTEQPAPPKNQAAGAGTCQAEVRAEAGSHRYPRICMYNDEREGGLGEREGEMGTEIGGD